MSNYQEDKDGTGARDERKAGERYSASAVRITVHLCAQGHLISMEVSDVKAVRASATAVASRASRSFRLSE